MRFRGRAGALPEVGDGVFLLFYETFGDGVTAFLHLLVDATLEGGFVGGKSENRLALGVNFISSS